MAVNLPRWEQITADPRFAQLTWEQKQALRERYRQDFLTALPPERHEQFGRDFEAIAPLPEPDRDLATTAEDTARAGAASLTDAAGAGAGLMADVDAHPEGLAGLVSRGAQWVEGIGGLAASADQNLVPESLQHEEGQVQLLNPLSALQYAGEQAREFRSGLMAGEDNRRQSEGQPTIMQERNQSMLGQAQAGLGGVSDDLRSGLSPEYQDYSRDFASAMDGGIDSAARWVIENPGKAAAVLTPDVIASLVPVGGAAKGAKIIGGLRGMTSDATAKLASTAGLGAGGAYATAAASGQAGDAVMAMPIDQLADTPEFQRLLDQGFTKDDARQYMAGTAAVTAAATSGVLNTAILGIGQKFGFNVVEDALAGLKKGGGEMGRIAAAADGIVREFASEATQGAGDQVASNLGQITAGTMAPEDIGEGVGTSALMEGLAAGPLGAISGLSTPATPEGAGAQHARALMEGMQQQRERDFAGSIDQSIGEDMQASVADPRRRWNEQAQRWDPIRQPGEMAAEAALRARNEAPAQPAPSAAEALQARNEEAPKPRRAFDRTPQNEDEALDALLVRNITGTEESAEAPSVPPSTPVQAQAPTAETPSAVAPTVPQSSEANTPPTTATPQSAVAAAQVVEPSASVPSANPSTLLDPDAFNRSEFDRNRAEVAQELNVPPDSPALERMFKPLDRDPVTGFHKSEQRIPFVQRAQAHVEQTGQESHYVEADIKNLNGLNAALGATGANEVYKEMAVAMKAALLEIPGVTVADVRNGGDEFSFTVVNAKAADVEAALAKGQQQAQAIAEARGLTETVNPKEGRSPGTGVIFARKQIEPGESLDDLFGTVDREIERLKKEVPSGNRTRTEARTGQDDARTARTVVPGGSPESAGSDRGGRQADGAAAGTDAEGSAEGLNPALFRHGKNREALRLADGTWMVRRKQAGRWQGWEPRATFSASPALGYKPASTPTGQVRIPGMEPVVVGERQEAEAPQASKPKSLLAVLARSGGLSREAFQRTGVDPADFKRTFGVGKWLFPKNGGMTVDGLREWMQENDYLPRDTNGVATVEDNDALDALMRALGGEEVFASGQEADVMQARAAERDLQGPDPATAAEDALADELTAVEALEQSAGVDIAIGEEAEALTISELTGRLIDAGLSAEDAGIELEMMADRTPAEQANGLWRTLKNLEARNESAQDGKDRQRSSEGQDTANAERQGTEGDAEGESADRDGGVEGDQGPRLTLAAQEVPRETPRTAQQSGLFGAPTAREQLTDAQRRKDEARDGKDRDGRKDMMAGDGELFAGPRPDQSGLASRAPALTPRQERVAASIRSLLSRLRNKPKLVIVDSAEQMPGFDPKRDSVDGEGSPEGFYQPGEKGEPGTVYLVASALQNPARARWVAAHEIIGHFGLRGFFGERLDPELRRAGANPTIDALARKIAAERGKKFDADPLQYIEEALAEIIAADDTAMFDALMGRYGIDATKFKRPDGVIARVVAAVKRILAGMGIETSDSQVQRLVADAFAFTEGRKKGAAKAETAPKFSRALKLNPESGVVKSGTVLYHGTRGRLSGNRRPIYLTDKKKDANAYAAGLIPGTGKGQNGRPVTIAFTVTDDARILDANKRINDAVMEMSDETTDEAINKSIKQAIDDGFDFVWFEHPSIDGTEMNALIAVGEWADFLIEGDGAPPRFSRAPAVGSPEFRESIVTDESGAPAPVLRSAAIDSVLSGKPQVAESGMDGLRGNAELVANLLQSPTFRAKGLGGFDAPTQRVVLASVLSFGYDAKVLDAVVELVPVDVVNILTEKELSADSLFRDRSVLKNLLSADGDGSVATAGDVADALAVAVAGVTAEDSGLVGLFGGALEGGAAAGARFGYLSVNSSHDGLNFTATGNRGATPVTAKEAEGAGLTEAEANEAQAQGDIRFSRAPVFHSAAAMSIEQAKGAPKKADVAAWKGWLDGAQRRGEFKQAERDWLGLDEFLDSQPGPITRDALAEFVRANEVRVEEVTLEPHDEFDGATRAPGSGAKFANYRTPGGENYKELLLTLPAKNDGMAPGFRVENRNGSWGVVFPNGSYHDGWRTREDAVDSQRNQKDVANYRSSHWDQPNVLAHVRFDERTDSDGKRVLFIQEIQSDWHQAGRKRGYADTPLEPSVREDANVWVVKFADGRAIDVPKSEANNANAARSIAAARRARDPTAGFQSTDPRVPNAPLKQTDEWAMLAFKRMARHAVDNGFDRIAWVTGEQAADLFDLSKQVDSVIYKKNPDGTFRLSALTSGRGNPMGDSIAAEKLEDFVGKDVAKRIVDGEGRVENLGGPGTTSQPRDDWMSLSGDGLKVGGEGMRGFYDKILPAAVGKWAKKFGAKVGQGETLGPALDKGGKPIVGALEAAAVHSIDITPAMREAASQSQPLFSRAPTSPLIPQASNTTPPKLTVAQTAMMAKAGLPVETRTWLTRVADSVREEWAKVVAGVTDADGMKQAVADRFHGIKVAMAQVGLEVTNTKNPYTLARLTTSLASVMESIMRDGAPLYDDGLITIKKGTKGLAEALSPVKDDLNEWLAWMVARRAKALMAEGRENLFTDADIKAGLSLANGREARFKRAAMDYLTTKNAILDLAQDAGLIDPVQRAAWDAVEYIPFYRQTEGGATGPGTQKGLANQTSGIKRLKGGEANLMDPLGNILRNFSHLVDASMKNIAMREAVDVLGDTMFTKAAQQFAAERIPVSQIRKFLLDNGMSENELMLLDPAAMQGVAKMIAIKPPTGKDVVRVMRNGKSEYYHVTDPLLLRSLSAFAPKDKGGVRRVMMWAKRLMTQGVTLTLEFVGANWLRDSGQAYLMGGKGARLVVDALEGVVKTIKRDEATQQMMMAGASFMGGQFYGGDQDAAVAALRRSLRSHGLKSAQIDGFVGTVARNPAMVWDAYLRLNSGAENSTRWAVYQAAKRRGASDFEAAFLSKDIMDFSMRGDSAFVEFLADTVPFLNARIQGLYRLGRGLGDKEERKLIIMRGTMLAAASTSLYLWNVMAHGDGYDELEEWDKDAYWHIAPGTDYHVRIPKPFELGLLFATIPERVAQAYRYQSSDGKAGDRPADSWKAFKHAITSTLSFDPTPQAVKPLIEVWANKNSFTGRPIENPNTRGQKLPSDIYHIGTSDLIKFIGSMVSDRTGVSPLQMEHLWKGYTAGIGGYTLEAGDHIYRRATDKPPQPEMALRDMLFVGRFLRGGTPARSTKYTTDFHEYRQTANAVSGSIKDRIERGDQDGARLLYEKHAWLLGAVVPSPQATGGIMFANVRELERANRAGGEVRDRVEQIRADRTLTPEQKRSMIDSLTQQRNDLMETITKTIYQLERQAGGKRG